MDSRNKCVILDILIVGRWIKLKKKILRRRVVNKLTSDLPKLCRFAVFSCKLKFNAEKIH